MGSRDSSNVMGFTPKSRFRFWGLEVSFGMRLSLLVLTRFAISSQVARSVSRPIFCVTLVKISDSLGNNYYFVS